MAMATLSNIATIRGILQTMNSVESSPQADLAAIQLALANLKAFTKVDHSGIAWRVYLYYNVSNEHEALEKFNSFAEYKSGKGAMMGMDWIDKAQEAMVEISIKNLKGFNIALMTAFALLEA